MAIFRTVTGCIGTLVLVALLAGGGLLAYWYYTDDDEDNDPTPTATQVASGTTVPSDGTPTTPPSSSVATPDVRPGDDVGSCMRRNMTPELLLSLYRDETEQTNAVIRACLETQLPSELVGVADPIIREASECAADTAQTLSSEEVLILGGGTSSEKDEVIQRVVRDTLECVAEETPLDVT